jgi:GH35 family endo-1,4-beta-xylanase
MLNLVKALQAAKVPIDGIGMESHLIVGEVPAASAFISNFEQFTALGIEVAVTELDIRMTLPATPALLAQQVRHMNWKHTHFDSRYVHRKPIIRMSWLRAKPSQNVLG